MFWKIYAILLLVVVLLGMTAAVTGEEPLTKWELSDMPISIIGLIGVVAFAFKKAIFRPRFWKNWLVLSILWGFLFWMFSSRDIFEYGIATGIIASILALPAYLALFLYGYRSKEIWNK